MKRPALQRRRLAIVIAAPRLAFLTFCLLMSLTCAVFAQSPPPEWLPNDRGLNPQTPHWALTADGDSLERAQHLHPRGVQWYLYSIKVPLAWKIT